MARILYIESGTWGGGSFRSLHDLVKGLDRDAYEPVVAFVNHNRFEQPLTDLGVPVHVLTDPLYSRHAPEPVRRALDAVGRRLARHAPAATVEYARLIHWPTVRALTRIIRDRKIDIVHLNVQPNRDLFGFFAAARTGTPCISHLRSVLDGGFGPRHAALVNRTASAFVAVSSATRRHWADLGLDAAKMMHIPNGIPVPDAEPLDLHTTWGLGEEVTSVVTCVENLNEWGGQHILLDAFARLTDNGGRSDVALLIVGDGPLHEGLVQQARELGIHERVIFTGYQDRARRILASSDVSVLPSDRDAMSRVVVESMLVGTPVVAADTGGIRDILVDGENGLLVRPADPDALAAAIERLLVDDSLSRRLAAAAEQTAHQGYTIQTTVRRIEELYDRVLNPRSEPPVGGTNEDLGGPQADSRSG